MTLTGGASCSLIGTRWGRSAPSSKESVKKKPGHKEAEIEALRKEVAALKVEVATLKQGGDKKINAELLKGKEKKEAETAKKVAEAAKKKKQGPTYASDSWDGGYNVF